MRAKRRIFSGCVCEQEVYTAPDRTRNVKKAEPRPRFSSKEEYDEFKRQIARRNFARKVNATFSPQSLYITLTLDRENGAHTYEEADAIINPFWRRLRRLNPDAQIVLAKGFGKRTSRIHFHMIVNGITEEQIREKWNAGRVARIEHLRKHNYYDGIDHGQDYTGLANYLFDHWTPEQGTRHYKGTKNLCEPETEDATEAKREYSEKKPPKAPKGYKLVSAKITPYGYMNFKYVKDDADAADTPTDKGKRRLKC